MPAALCEIVPELLSATFVAVSGALKVIVGEVSDTELFDVTGGVDDDHWVVKVGVVLAVSDALFSVIGAPIVSRRSAATASSPRRRRRPTPAR